MCDKQNANILRTFQTISEVQNDIAMTQGLCKTFCSFNHKCWGCSLFCELNCTWNAVEHCESTEPLEAKKEKYITQKPGNIALITEHYCSTYRLYVQNSIGYFLSKFIACVDVYQLSKDNFISWSLGSCTSDDDYEISDNLGYTLNVVRCCLAPGEHILTCKAASRMTWLTGYILIDGRKYCNDFIGLKAFRRLQINSNSL